MERTDIREDLEDQFNWTRIEATFQTIDGIETLNQRVTLYDNGTTIAETLGEVSPFGDTFDRVVFSDAPEGAGVKVWNRIEILTIEGIDQSVRKISYDTGVIRYEYLDAGEVTTFVSFDNPLPNDTDLPDFFNDPTTQYRLLNELVPGETVPAGIADWYMTYRVVDPADGSVTTGFDRDDFVRTTEERTNGILVERRLQDLSGKNGREDLHDWEFIRETFDADGLLSERKTFYDDDSERTQTFTNGIIQSEVWLDVDAPYITVGGAQPWTSIETRYNENGVIENRFTQYDDGTERSEFYTDGVLSDILQTDNQGLGQHGNAQPWTAIQTYFYDNGVIAERLTTFDDGTRRDEYHNRNGVLNTILQYDLDAYSGEAGVQPWETLETFFDENGIIRQRDTYYDDGTDRYEQYTNGVLTEVQLIDPDYGATGLHPWKSIKTFYEPDGQVSSIQLVYDDGLERLDTYENGVRRRIEKIDGPDGSDTDTQNWSQHVQVYDADGGLLENALTYDDGTFVGDGYTNGVRTLRLQVDNPGDPDGGIHPWTRIATSYSETDGTVLARSISFDDGTITATGYQDGALRTLQRTDAPTGDGVEDWSISITTYENAKIAHQFLVFDDGAKQESTFENGQLVSRLDEFNVRSIAPTQACFTEDGIDCSGQTPPPPLVQKRQFIYDEDQRIAEIHTLFAIGDVKSVLFEDGQIAEQHIFDRLNFQPWEARKLIYDDAGQVSDVIDFFERDQIPSDFAAATVSPGFESPELSISARSFGSADPFEPFVTDGDNPTVPSQDDFTGLPGTATPPTVDTFTPGGTATAPTLDEFGGGGISVTGGSVTLTNTDLSDGSTPPSLDEFDGTQVSAGGGITLTGGGSSTVPSAVIVAENTEQPPEIFDFV